MRFHCPPPSFGRSPLRSTYGRDPDGNVIELQEIFDPALPISLENAPGPTA